MKFLDELKMQRWDDHRYYHQSRINQSLHLLSSMSFLGAYILLFINPVLATFLGWFIAMIPRQVGHFFFEPKDYDQVNQATHTFKESIKVGYNLHRKVVLLSIWALMPVALYYYPTMFGVFEPYADLSGYLDHLAMMWLALGVGALLFRTCHLFFIQNVQAGLVWFTKILTDPFHDIKIYHKSPFYLLKGELLDPMHDVK
jgi:hypothetical protein